MLLKSIELHNLRQYKGDNRIDFSTDPDNNVTLILGINTSGKTTLVHAFKWVLYEDRVFKDKAATKEAILTDSVGRSMRKGDRETASAKITLVHNNVTYEIERIYNYECKIPGAPSFKDMIFNIKYVDVNGDLKPLLQFPAAKVDEILPEELSQFFFFNGENIKTYTTKGNIKQAINAIMGLAPIVKMIEHIKGGDYDRGTSDNVLKKFNSMLVTDSRYKEVEGQLRRKENLYNTQQHNAEEESKHLQRIEDQIVSKRVEMELIKDVAEDAAELKRVDAKLELQEANEKSALKRVEESFTPMLSELMVNYLASKLLSEMKEFNYEDKGVPDMTAASVDYIIKRGKCICGMLLSENPNCLKELNELRTYLPPESIGTQLIHFNAELERLIYIDSRKSTFDANLGLYYSQIDHTEELMIRRQELSRNIGKNTDADKIKASYDILMDQKERARDMYGRFDKEARDLKKEIDQLTADLKKLAGEQENNAAVLLKIKYAEALLEKAVQYRDEQSAIIFKKVDNTLKDVFSDMYHGELDVSLNKSYEMSLTVESGSSLDNSNGLDTVQNFAFISTLLKVAKKRIDEGIETEPYPLVLDAIFSDTDDIHIKNICRALPDVTEQAVLVIMEKDWKIAHDVLESRVGKKYHIVKDKEALSHIEVI